MGTVLVTVAGPGGEVDLAVPGDVEVAALIPAVVRHCEPEPHPWSRWALGLPGGEPSHPGRRSALWGSSTGPSWSCGT